MSSPTASSLNIRLAETRDLAFLVAGARQLAELEHTDSRLELKTDFATRLEQYFNNLLNTSSALTLVAERNGKPLAYISGSLQPMPNDFTTVPLYGLIQVLWVEPDARRLQLGQTLLSLFEATLREQGVHHIDTQHAHSNLPAKEFWQKCGYAPVSISCRKLL